MSMYTRMKRSGNWSAVSEFKDCGRVITAEITFVSIVKKEYSYIIIVLVVVVLIILGV